MSSEATPEPASALAAQPRARRHPVTLLLPLLPLLAVAAVWYFAGLGRLNSPEKIAAAAQSLRDDPLAPLYVVGAFVVGTLLFFPVTALIAGTVLAFDLLHGILFAWMGTVLAACSTYWAGRALGGRALDYVSGPRLLRFGALLRAHAIRASIAARILPVGNFTMINVFVGSLRVPFGSFVIGNMIGVLPGVLFVAFFAEQLAQAVRAPSRQNLTYLGIAVALGALVAYLLRVRHRRARR